MEDAVFIRMTNCDGRASGFLSWEDFDAGIYKISFNTGSYFRKTETESFFPAAEVTISVT